MRDKCAVISVIYRELEWADTERCLETGCPPHPVFFVDRRGVGSLSKALNAGFKQWANGAEYIWFVTNVLFDNNCLHKLIEQMDKTGFAAISPAFNSDYVFCKPEKGCTETKEVPFIEFTAPIIRADVFREIQLDEDMPYWGHDIDWGYRVRQKGYSIGVYHGAQLGHSYIRNTQNNNRFTERRKELRYKTNSSTKQALVKKYGGQWRKVLHFFG
jgi:GT2 family glycosyltransferase